MKSLDKLIKIKKEYDENIAKQGEAAVKEYLTEWFDKHPDVYGIIWSQYTPYFNDGDECIFHMNDIHGFSTEELFDDASDYDEGDVDYHIMIELTDKFQTVEDIFKVVFGDHVTVKVTRHEFTVDEYSHD